MDQLVKTVGQFYQDPVKYFNQSAKNVETMSNRRKITIALRSVLWGTGVGLGTLGLSLFTGSNRTWATTTAVTAGMTVIGLNTIYETHEYDLVD